MAGCLWLHNNPKASKYDYSRYLVGIWAVYTIPLLGPFGNLDQAEQQMPLREDLPNITRPKASLSRG